MSSFKLLNHFLTLRSSTPLFYSPFRFTLSLRYCFSSHKNPIFCSSQSRLFSSASNISSYMELVKEVASKGPESQENIAIRADEKSYTYLQLISSARRISNLLSNLDLKIGNGIKRNVDLDGARVGIVAKPCAEFVAGILGTWLRGGVAVPLALSYPETELLHVMNDSVDFMPKFSVRGIWQKWRESYPTDGTKTDNAITVFTGVPTMYTRLIQGYEAMEPELKAASASAARHLRLMMCGSSALPLPVMQQWETITGHRLLERYGMTEFVMAISNPIKGKRKGGTVGKPFSGVQAKILLDDESGSDKTGVGELCIKSPSLFKEYWRLPEVTKQSFTDDGFFKTGDAVTVDEEGYYIILGRTNADIMKVGGYKLSALEIEAVLLEHPTISECCVLGLPDKDYGEVVCAIVVPDAELKRKQDEELKPALSLQELSDWAKERLAPYKIPNHLYVWDSLPRNAMGKVNKKELKRKLADDPK